MFKIPMQNEIPFSRPSSRGLGRGAERENAGGKRPTEQGFSDEKGVTRRTAYYQYKTRMERGEWGEWEEQEE